MRVINTLKSVDIVAAEDTRRTLKLLNHYDIKVPLLSYHRHNLRSKTAEIIALVESGKKVALVSDAGSPGISDPGEELVKAAIEKGLRIESLPGPTAFVPALTASGLPAGRFCFEGFLPRKKSDREKRLSELEREERTMLFYEAPHRLIPTLKDMLCAFGNRQVCVARELTKRHEDYYRGDIEGAIDRFGSQPPRGEFTIVVAGRPADPPASPCSRMDENEMKQRVAALMEQGTDKQDAIKQVAVEYGIPKRQVYRAAIGIKFKEIP